MSGRVRVTHTDGRVTTGYRKTDRRNPRRSKAERLHILNETRSRRVITAWKVRLGFLLPEELEPFVSSGPHGTGVEVYRGFVQVSDDSADQCYARAKQFFAAIAADRGPYVVAASVIYPNDPDSWRYTPHLLWSGEWLAIAGRAEPRIYL